MVSRIDAIVLWLSVMCAAATPAVLDGETSAGIEARLIGRCEVDGPCQRFPQQGGRREDNQQGYLLYGAGISPEHCALRAREHHTWCGNHPDAVVHTTFERETRRTATVRQVDTPTLVICIVSPIMCNCTKKICHGRTLCTEFILLSSRDPQVEIRERRKVRL